MPEPQTYLSRLTLNPENADVRRDLASPYELHRTLMRAFPDGARGEGRLLFRVEPEGVGRGVAVLVQSHPEAPCWGFLRGMKDYACCVEGPKAMEPALCEGQRLRFRLVANPTKKVRNKRVPLLHDGPNPKNHPTYHDWLGRKAAQHGFEVLRVEDAPFRTVLPNRRKDTYDKKELPLFGVRFDGVLRVTDAEALLEAVRGGVGPAKAFGFGLLSLAPAS